MALPATPKRPTVPSFLPVPTIGPLAARTATTDVKRPPIPLSEGKTTLAVPAPARKATKEASPPIVNVGIGWEACNGEIKTVSAPLHERKLSACCSWLHSYEHARYLHNGVKQGEINWPSYLGASDTNAASNPSLNRLASMHKYLSTILPSLPRPDPSLETVFPANETKEELQAAYKKGEIHYTGSLTVMKDPRRKDDKLVFKMNPPAAGTGCALYRKYGSDRFFRITLDDEVTRRAAPSFDSGRISPRDEALRAQIQTFFRHPLVIFGRKYRAFCWKDGAAVFWCEGGAGLESKSLVRFAEEYLEVALNGSMSVAKYAARFELGLTTTTQTVRFPRTHVMRTPDLNNDTLKMSPSAMQEVCRLFTVQHKAFAKECCPNWYTPSCIRAAVRQTPSSPPVHMVYQLDYSSTSSLTSPFTRPYIEVYPFSSGPSRVTSPIFEFFVEAKNGTVRSVSAAAGEKGWEVRWMKEKKVKEKEDEVVMTDGCSLRADHTGFRLRHYQAMREIATKLNESRGGEVGSKVDVPAVAQGRIGGGKGVWAFAPSSHWDEGEKWIEVRDSQWKFKDRQTTTFTFELHSVPSGKGSAKL
ncbi:hypothetical protein JCM11641_002932, partial [Rhodosporidiobolus odoratus]